MLGFPGIFWLNATVPVPPVLALVSAATVGALVASRRPRHPVGLLVALVVARGSLDPRYQADNSPLDFRGLGGALLVVNQVALAVTLLTLIVAAASLVVRFRRARGLERQQLRCVAWAAVLVVLAAVIALASSMLGLPEVVGWAAGICVALLPLAIGAAILRYRLYDLDHIVSRTLTWGLLTVLLGGGYAVVVLGLGQLLGHDSSLVVAGATLAAAALFQPARRRIQQAVDRRFNRRRHDAATGSRRSATICASRSTWRR